MEQITKDANGLSDSYNGLVKQLADLKQEWRAVDQSTEEGRARFVELGKQINETNDKLKAMDASTHNLIRVTIDDDGGLSCRAED